MKQFRRRRWADPGPRFLEATADVRVRFHEVDGLRVVWHGHYLTYFEDGRLAFGRRYAFGYHDLLAAGYVVPLVHADVDYFAPASYDDRLIVRTRLHPEDGARIVFTYSIELETGRRLATGMTVQAFTDLDGTLLLTRPAFYEEFLRRWDAEMRRLP